MSILTQNIENAKSITGTVPENFSNIKRVNKSSPCYICKKTDWCGYTSDGRLAFCLRVSEGAVKQARNGAWIHVLNKHENFDFIVLRKAFQTKLKKENTQLKKEKPQSKRAIVSHLHKVYSAMLGILTLEDRHRENLIKRGLSYEAIKEGSYKSTPSFFDSSQVAYELSRMYDLRGVPGFYMDFGVWRMVSLRPGFLIPYRNTKGQIYGLQVRLDRPVDGKQKYVWVSSANYYKGTSSSSPIHFSRPGLIDSGQEPVDTDNSTYEVLITEGGLKADVISYFTNSPVIAAAGVNNFGEEFAANLRKRFPTLRKTILCFDMDFYEKAQVRLALFKFGIALSRACFDVCIRDWQEEFKGYDDFLLARARNFVFTEAA